MCGGGGDTGYTADQEEDANRQARIARQRQQQILDQQQGEANDFRSKKDSLENQLDTNLTNTSRYGLASDLNSSQVNASRRGILNSRLNDANQGQLRAQAATNLAGAKSDVSSRLNAQANNMDAMAAQGTLNDFNQRQQIEDDIYSRAMQRVQQRGQLYGQVGQAAGTAAGIAAAAG